MNRRIEELRAEYDRQQEVKLRAATDGEPAVTGKKRADGSVSLYGDDAHNDRLPTNKIYVRLYGHDEAVHEAWAANVGRKVNAEVRVKRNQKNQYYVDRLDDEGATRQFGEQAGDFAVPVQTGAVPHRIEGRSLIPLSARLSTVGGLTVTVEAGTYVDDAGVTRRFPQTDITLTAPPTAGNSAYAVVYLDRTDGTLDFELGNEQPIPATALLDADWEAITETLTSTQKPLWAIPLTNGQTGFTTLEDWIDLRGIGSSGGVSPVTPHDIVSTEHADTDTLIAPAEGDLLVYRSSLWTPEETVDIGTDDADIDAINFNEQGSDIATPGADHWVVYFKSDGMYIRNDAGTVIGPLSAGGHNIEDEGTPLTQRADLDFTGPGVVASDTGAKTQIQISRWVPLMTGGGVDSIPVVTDEGEMIMLEYVA